MMMKKETTNLKPKTMKMIIIMRKTAKNMKKKKKP